MQITAVGFGAWAIGGGDWSFGWGAQDDADSIAAIRHALDKGINWIDTAAVYGLGHSEEVVRRALTDIPLNEQPLVFTKGGLLWDDEDRMNAIALTQARVDPARMRSLATSPRGRADRSLPVSLARSGHSGGGFLGRDDSAD